MNSNAREIDLIYSGYGLSEDSRRNIKAKALVYHIDTAKIVINSGAKLFILDHSKQRYEVSRIFLQNNLNAAGFNLQSSERRLDSIQHCLLKVI